MKKFLYGTILFCLPFIIGLGITMAALKISGESYTNIDKHIKTKYLIGYAYDESNYKYLKWKELTSREPHNVVALGSSRVLQFTDEMFKGSFYNCGYTIRKIYDFRPFLQELPAEKHPDVLIIALYQWMFNPEWESSQEATLNKEMLTSFSRTPSGEVIKNTTLDLIKGKYKLSSLDRSNGNIKKIGINAVVKNTGFKEDGSMLYGDIISKLKSGSTELEDYKYRSTLLKIKEGSYYFKYSDTINIKALAELDALLKYCKEKNIFVIAFLPPFADTVNTALEDTGKYGYMDKIYPMAKKVTDKYGYELWDLHDLATYDSNDNETIDGFHGGDVTHLKMLLYLNEKGSVIKKFTNSDRLKDDLDHRIDNYSVYKY